MTNINAFCSVLIVVAMMMWIFSEYHKTKKAKRRLVQMKWNLTCDRLLLWRVINRQKCAWENDDEFKKLMADQDAIAKEFCKLGGDPEEVNFWRIYRSQWFDFTPTIYEDSKQSTQAMKYMM